jgi:hypothetical protein
MAVGATMTYVYRRVEIPTNAHPLVCLLFETMRERRITVQEVADRSGVHRDTLRDWRKRHCATVENLEACFNVVGMTLQPVPLTDKAPRQKLDRIADIMGELLDRPSAAAQLGISVVSLRRLDIPYRIINNRCYYHRDDLKVWVAGHPKIRSNLK